MNNPTPEEIAKATARIRADWPEDVARKRAGCHDLGRLPKGARARLRWYGDGRVLRKPLDLAGMH